MELRKNGQSTEPFHKYSPLGGVLKRGQSAVDVPCRPVTSGGTVFCSLVLYPSPVFPEFLGTTEEGSKYDTFPRYSLGGASTLLNMTCRPLFSRLRAIGLSLVLQCTSVCLRAGRTWFLTPSGSQITAFSRVDFTNFLDRIRKGCVPIYASSCCRSRLRRATGAGASRA